MHLQWCPANVWHRDSILASQIASLFPFSTFWKIYFNVTEINYWQWLEESGQRLDNADRTLLELAS